MGTRAGCFGPVRVQRLRHRRGTQSDAVADAGRSPRDNAGSSLRALLAVAPATLLTQQSQPASAFANSLPPDELMLKYPSPKTPGPKPGDIGPRDGGALKPCIDGKPHCFSSSAEQFDDEFNAGELPEDWLVDPFRFDKSAAEAMADLKDAVAAYPPGQRGIDGVRNNRFILPGE